MTAHYSVWAAIPAKLRALATARRKTPTARLKFVRYVDQQGLGGRHYGTAIIASLEMDSPPAFTALTRYV
jgi:hypothetical protein